MGPRQNKIWLPLTRLGAFFVAVVVTGNVVLHTFRPETADTTESPDRSVDYYTRKKKRLERQFQKTMERFLGAPAATPPVEKVGLIPVDPTPPVLCVVPSIVPQPVTTVPMTPAPAPSTETASAATVLVDAPTTRPSAEPAPKSAVLAFLSPEPAAFIWPEPLPANPPRAIDLPLSLSMMEETAFRAELVADVYRRCAPDPVADVGDAILKGPELVLDGIFRCTSGMGNRVATRNWDDDDRRSIMAQILDVQVGARKERIWSEFMTQLTQRELKYLANFGESRANTAGFEDRTQDADHYELLLDQRKVLWDALRRTYLARYKVQAEEKIKDDAWYIDRWSGLDFALLPPLMAGYIYYRGLEKRFTIVGTKLSVSIEPLSEWVFKKHDLAAAAAFEWKMKDWPLGVIVSVGLYEGRYGLDFVGIGTSIGAVRRAIVMQQGEGERR
jgi:hypothetical protein